MTDDDSNDADRPIGREARGRAAERVVRPRDVLAALADVRRLGRRRALEALEAAEPDLAEYALEELSAVHRRMADLGWRPRAVRRLAARVERMTLVLVTAVRNARLRLWRDEDVDPLQPHKGDIAAAAGGSGTSAPQATTPNQKDDFMTNQNTTDDASPGDTLVVRRPTRADAVRAGVLVDLTPWARVAGFVWPVACTAALWHGCVVPPDDPVPVGQSARGRAHGLLWVLREEVRGRRRRAAAPPTDRLTFGVLFVAASGRPAEVRVRVVAGRGDAGEPVLTLMLAGEG